jgi:phage FluMu protein Com
MKLQILFYVLIAEVGKGKNKEIKMRGPFLHKRPAELFNTEIERYIMNEKEIRSEKNFISKKYSNEVPLFKTYDIVLDAFSSSIICTKCNKKFRVLHSMCGTDVDCAYCKEVNSTRAFDYKIFDKFRREYTGKADLYFELRFEEMRINFQMCNR